MKRTGIVFLAVLAGLFTTSAAQGIRSISLRSTTPDSSSRTIDVPTAGTLSTLVTLDQAATTKTLKLKGLINNADIDFLRSYTPLLANLDLSEVVYYSNNFQNYGLQNKTSLVRISMPKHVIRIGYMAFSGCSALQRIILPDSLQYIDSYAFQNCILLDSVVLPPKVSTLSGSAFNNCQSLQGIQFPKGLKTMDGSVFYNCYNLKTAILSDTLTTIQSGAFYGCRSLKTVHLPARLNTISSSAFKGCSALDSIAFPVTLTTINDEAFESCSSLRSAYLPANLSAIGGYVFRNCSSLVTVVFPPTLATIPGYNFYNCPALKTVILPNNLLIIQGYQFFGCTSLKNIRLPNVLESLGNYSFFNCSSLDTLRLPQSVKSVGENSFNGCTSLKVAVLSNNMTEIRSGTFNGCVSLDSVSLPVGVINIKDNVFIGCRSLKGQLVIPATVTSIGYQAFHNTGYRSCKSLAVTPPSLYYSLGNIKYAHVAPEAASAYKSEWTDIMIVAGDTLTKVSVNLTQAGTLGDAILQKVSYLKDVHELTISGPLNSTDMNLIKQSLPSLLTIDLKLAGLTQIPDQQFNGNKLLLSIILPDSLEFIGNQAFTSCSNLRTITIPKKVSVLGSSLFNGNTCLESVYLPTGLTRIESYIFNNCPSLTTVMLPDAITNIPYQAFYGCNSLKNITFPARLKTIEANAFYDCKLTSLQLPDSVESIGDNAFRYNKISRLRLKPLIHTVGSYAFGDNPIDTAFLTRNLYTLGGGIFYNCTMLKNIACEQVTPPSLSNNAFYGVTPSSISLTVPAWSSTAYKQADGWSTFYPIYSNLDSVSSIPVRGKLVLNDNARFTGKPDVSIYTNASMTVRGNTPLRTKTFTLNADLSYDSYYSSFQLYDNYAQFINECQDVSADQVRISLQAKANAWYFLTLPFDAAISDITKSNANAQFVFRHYDGAERATGGTGNSWKTLTEDSIVKSGNGYIFQCSDDGIFTFTATESSKLSVFDPATWKTPLKVNASTQPSNGGWNLVGNPYPSFFNSLQIDFAGPITVWNYMYKTYEALSLTDDSYVLKPYEAFFVQKPTDMAYIGFLPAGRQLTEFSEHGGYSVRKRSAANRSLINLTLNDNESTDKCRVVINEGASQAYELGLDATKFMSMVAAVPQLYTIDPSNNRLSINERPTADGCIRLGCRFGNTGTYTIAGHDLQAGGKTVTLRDNLLHQETVLNEASYTFTSDKGTFDGRFEIRLNTPTGLSAQNDVNPTKVWSSNGKLNVETKPGNNIRVYTPDGFLVGQWTAKTLSTQLSVEKGVYLIQVDNHMFKSVVY